MDHHRSISLALAASLLLAAAPAFAGQHHTGSTSFGGMGTASGLSMNGGSTSGSNPVTRTLSIIQSGTTPSGWTNPGTLGSWPGGWNWQGNGGSGSPTPPTTPTPTPIPTPTLLERVLLGLGSGAGGGSSSSMPDYNCTSYGYSNAPQYCALPPTYGLE